MSSLQPSTVVFDIDDTSLWVIFTAQQPKTEAIRSVHPALCYGDSDGDIADTHEADPAIRAIRITPSPVSYNERLTTPGRYGEEILADSAD